MCSVTGYTLEIDRARKIRCGAGKIARIFRSVTGSRLQGRRDHRDRRGGAHTGYGAWTSAKRNQADLYDGYKTDKNLSGETRKGQTCSSVEGCMERKDKAAKAVEYKHMTFYEAAETARNAQVREMWLTHYSPSLPVRNST